LKVGNHLVPLQVPCKNLNNVASNSRCFGKDTLASSKANIVGKWCHKHQKIMKRKPNVWLFNNFYNIQSMSHTWTTSCRCKLQPTMCKTTKTKTKKTKKTIDPKKTNERKKFKK
jgi:hypothetical protein